MPGDVVVAVDYSTVNYKDALAITGRAEVIRQFPLILVRPQVTLPSDQSQNSC